jgi:hypothetical protein
MDWKLDSEMVKHLDFRTEMTKVIESLASVTRRQTDVAKDVALEQELEKFLTWRLQEKQRDERDLS